jgi:hypothetical protein
MICEWPKGEKAAASESEKIGVLTGGQPRPKISSQRLAGIVVKG